MYKIVREQPATRSIAQVSMQKYYGALLGTQKAFLTRSSFNDGLFVWRAPECVTNGNGFSGGYSGNDVAQTITKLLEKNWQVFEFDTYDELFRWLSSAS